jgi:hypothetical protein
MSDYRGETFFHKCFTFDFHWKPWFPATEDSVTLCISVFKSSVTLKHKPTLRDER